MTYLKISNGLVIKLEFTLLSLVIDSGSVVEMWVDLQMFMLKISSPFLSIIVTGFDHLLL